MNRELVLAFAVFLFSLVLASCGGGGGGGSDSSPDRVNNNGPTEPEDLQTGLFTDAPVTGLRYVQGDREGYTDSGRFTYNANSSKPVCFYIDELLLGCAHGGEVVTPYHLAAPGQPAGLQSGYNISRLLISLDQSTAPEIDLPPQNHNIKGSINFALSDGAFATDIVVTDLVERYAPSGTLASRQQANDHMADNADVQQAINNLHATLDAQISNMNIQWDSTLAGPGVLAHVEASASGSSSPSEHLYLEVSNGEGGLYLSRITHVDTQGRYTYLTLNESGYPFKVSKNGRNYAYINMLDTTLESIIATSSYQPKRSGNLVGNGGLSDSIETAYIQDQQAEELVAAVENLSNATFNRDDMLRVASHASSYVRGVACANESEHCNTYLQDALLLAEVDDDYANRVIGWEATELSPRLCLNMVIPGMPGEERCSFAPNLEQFNVVMAQQSGSYSGAGKVEPETELSFLYEVAMHDWIGNVGVNHRFVCVGGLELYSFSDDNFYIESKNGACYPLSSSDVFSVMYPEFECTPSPYQVTIEYCDDIVDFSDWQDFNEKRELAYRIANRYVKYGIGQRLSYFGLLDGMPSYVDTDRLNARESIPDFSALNWFDSYSVGVEGEDFYANGVIENLFGYYSPTPLGTLVQVTDSKLNLGMASLGVSLKYRSPSALGVTLDIRGIGLVSSVIR
ncbi:MAG: hypothetical protein VYA55_06755 [Pseudomonadota bacterium]|nr:hypothetical protein [Pseudomonadota bacterium]